jgi:hypothetical protein
MQDLGRLLVVMGIVLALAGGAIILAGKIPGLGHLPGDIAIQRDGFSCFFPIATTILLSIVVTVLLNVVLRLLNR